MSQWINYIFILVTLLTKITKEDVYRELDNLRLNDRYKTNGFVEVTNISCIIGKYPKKLLELWNIYDNEKSSDNDCPSIFDENQLYIALELSHGGEDLEAYVFQTAEETCAVFLQVGCLYFFKIMFD